MAASEALTMSLSQRRGKDEVAGKRIAQRIKAPAFQAGMTPMAVALLADKQFI